MTQANYVGIADSYDSDKVIVWERDEQGRHPVSYTPPRYFFIEDSEGEYKSMYGTPLKKLSFDDKEEFKIAKAGFKKKFESDISPLQRVLMDVYYNRPIPKLNYAFFDIEARVFSMAGDSQEKVKIRLKL